MRPSSIFNRTSMGWRVHQRSSYWSFGFLAVVLVAVYLALSVLDHQGGVKPSIPQPRVTSSNLIEPLLGLANWHNRSYEGIFKAVLPVMNGEETNLPSMKLLLQMVVNAGSGASMGLPRTFLIAQLPLMQVTPESIKPQIISSEKIEHTKQQTTQEAAYEAPLGSLQGEPLVLIYNTHTGETYEKTDGLDRLPGKKGGVYLAAKALGEALEQKYRIKVVQSDTIHDDNFLMDNPYTKSGATVSALLRQYPSIKLVVDIHRDAGVERKNSVVEINGEKYASTMLVVGTNARQNHPNWKENYEFAQQVGKALDKKYPGLLRKIITKRGRYNQHLHPHALLVEVGSTQNSTEEAVRSAQLWADVLAEQLQIKP